MEDQVRLCPRRDTVVADVVENEAVIINVETGIYYSTEGSGGWIWANIAAGVPTARIRARLTDVADDAAAGQAFDAFVAQVKEEGLVEETDTGPDEPLEGLESYEVPTLVAYRDMKDLMALDPPMPLLQDPAN